MNSPIGLGASSPSPYSGIAKSVVIIVGLVIVVMAGLFLYNVIRLHQGKPTVGFFGAGATADQTPAPVDGKTGTTITAANVPLSQGSDYGIQFWMFIQDWDYKFGQEKQVLRRVSPTSNAVFNPKITLHPTDNSLQVSVSIFPSSSRTERSTPAPANDVNSTDDVFTCTVENVPLQSWFSVSVTTFQRNLDIYINGRLVKSCVLPGVPKPAVGDLQVAPDGGFSGSVCNVHSYSSMLTPDDAAAFFGAGTNCAIFTPKSSQAPTNTMRIFGYTFSFGILDDKGKDVKRYTF